VNTANVLLVLFFAGITPVLTLSPNVQQKPLALRSILSSVQMAIALATPLNARLLKPVLLIDPLDAALVNAESYLMNVQHKRLVLLLTQSSVLTALVLPM
jgi:hypothetical protein